MKSFKAALKKTWVKQFARERGILEREQEQSVVYGSVDFGKTVVTNAKYLDLLGKAGHHLKILPHKVLNEKNEEVELCSSVECKGIIGNDSRHYILDLLRTFPPDVNYLPIESEDFNNETKSLGYPRQHKHKLCCLRQELIDAFVEAKYLLFIKLAAIHLQQLGLKNVARDSDKKPFNAIGKVNETNGISEKEEIVANNNNESNSICHKSEENCSEFPSGNVKCHISTNTDFSKQLGSNDSNSDPTDTKSNECENSSSVASTENVSKLCVPEDDVCEKNSEKNEAKELSSESQDEESKQMDSESVSSSVGDPESRICSNESQSEPLNKLESDAVDSDVQTGVRNIGEVNSSEEVSEVVPADDSKSSPCDLEMPEVKELECDKEYDSDNKDFTYTSPSKAADKETDQYKKIVESYASGEKFEESTKDVIRKAALAVGSLKETEFDIRFNPDVFSFGVKHPNLDGEELNKQRQLVKDAADFLLSVQIPGLIRDCLEHSASPIDGVTLTEALHSRGINVRYLGRIADLLSKIPQLQYVYNLCVSELICRACKHVFTIYLQGVETICLAAAIAHFLNCFLSSALALSTPVGTEEMQIKSAKRKGKKKGKHSPFATSDNEWASLTQGGLWKELKSELESYYNWNLVPDSVDNVVEHYGLQKVSLLRSFCLKTGVQILLKDYNFDNRNRATFTEDDIINIFPIVKHINPRATDAYNFYSTGQLKIQQGFLKEGYELISEAFNLLNNVYGAMHPEIAQCLRMLARLNYLMGDHTEALAFQQKAVLMSERVNGIDHPYTITEYTHLALYCFANSQISTSLKLLYRARYLALLVCGESHPEVAVLDSNIGLILHAVGEYDLSLRFLQNALKLNIKYYGVRSLKVAVNYHLVARTQSCMGDFRGALQNEKETYSIYKFQLGEEHEKTKESSDCLRHLTQQAVVLQKTMNEIYKGTAGAILPPIQIQAPSMSSVLDMLNIINGILFVQISPQDIENIKGEMERRQQKENSEKVEEAATKDSEAEDTAAIPNGR